LDNLRAAIVSRPDEAVLYLKAYLADPSREMSLLRHAVTAQPDLAGAHFALSVRHLAGNDPERASLALKRTIALTPHAAAAHSNLATISEAQSDFSEALAPARRAALIEPSEVLFHANLGSYLSKTDQAAQSMARYRTAIALNPALYKVCLDYGITLAELGRRDAARAFFLRASRLDPLAVRPLRLWVELDKVTPSSPVLGLLTRLGGVQHRLPVAERSELSFALGKSFADLGEIENAFAAWRTANALRRSITPYDEAAMLLHFKTIAALFSAPVAEGPRGRQPIFIVGMPRCGSTLIEQILASHPDVAATGESKTLAKLMKRHGPSSFRAVGGAYLAHLSETYPAASRVTDKMLGNFTRLGFIAAALPGARIIHVRRDPIDCCLSIHSRHFLEGHPYAADLGELGRYYRAYDELMAHWRAVLPKDMITELVYEQLVDDLPGQVRALLDFLELPWEPRCLDFHKTDRIVRTASQSQVRAPLTRDGIGRWHPYIPYIGPLIDALGPLADRHYNNGA
jgi:tetratricopeptide (TPR) repeat protein